MIKYFLTLVLCILLADSAFCQKSDTSIIYYSYRYGVIRKVSNLQNADYFRLILPADSGDKRHNVKEYYKDGKIKLIGKLMADYRVYNDHSDMMFFDGDVVTFYPNGKKFSVGHYTRGNINGFEYRFYPNGRVYCTFKHILKSSPVFDVALYWECYDTLGNQICSEGKGRFIKHFENHGYPDMISEGPVVDGYADGEWNGHTEGKFDLKFIGQYKKGKLISSIGYDRDGNHFSFTENIENASYRSGEKVFVELLNNHIQLPKNADGKKTDLGKMHLYFVIEKDNHITHFRLPETADTTLKRLVFTALQKCDHWSPTKIYGVPIRTEIVMPLSELNKYGSQRVEYLERLIPEDEPLGK